MAEPRTYPHGVTCWVDTEQPDPDEAAHFYGELFDWTFVNAMPPGAPGAYLIATLAGQDVAAVSPAPGGAASWNTYVAVDSADGTAAAVTAAGGSVVSEPQDAGPGGRGATCRDPQGAEFRLWQPRKRLGAQLVNVPDSWNFSDLHTPDPAASMAFYAPLFGWVAKDLDQGAGTKLQVPGYGDHLAATVDPDIRRRQAFAPTGFADVIGGVVTTTEEQARWQVTFSVADRDESAATAIRLGADIVSGSDGRWVRWVVVRDPQGADITLSQFCPPDPAAS